MKHPIRLIAFDADDTLWDCQTHFDEVEKAYCALLAPYADARQVSASLFATESRNMPELGYGCKAFTISLVENAVSVSHGQISANDLLRVQELGRSLLRLPATPLPGVETTLRTIREKGKYQMAVFTKGEIQDQENKLRRSGLWDYFDRVVVVSDKTPAQYEQLCRSFGISIGELLMVGNSFKSDVEPVLQLGGLAVHVPFHSIWAHEQTDEYDHDNLTTLSSIEQLLAIV